MALSKVETSSGLLAIMNGRHTVPPDWVSYFIDEGWVEAVDVITGASVDRDHPKAVLRVTEAGRVRMAAQS
jgi:hypothetical protein